ncbi:hypothetical protein [Streptomonospora salina]|uniref:Secreted protein/lipoprotein n=1 Tax=Streptomonospora salina TaxID=104205 RepID=A0A841EIJ6_9ACTN|nr:hypothetical protein [Streptomonospora salina]MBB6000180.1 hypothetical protein [Streptomonospora salina]
MRYAVGAAVAGLVVVAGGCSAQEHETEAEPSPSAAATPAAKAQALEAYRGLMGAIVEGSHSGADDHPDLAWHAKGQALQHADDLLDGTQATGRPVLSPEVASVDTAAEPPTVVVKDCADTSDWQIADEDLEELGPLPDADGPRPITATVTEEGGAWQVAKLVFGEYGACER